MIPLQRIENFSTPNLFSHSSVIISTSGKGVKIKLITLGTIYPASYVEAKKIVSNSLRLAQGIKVLLTDCTSKVQSLVSVCLQLASEWHMISLEKKVWRAGFHQGAFQPEHGLRATVSMAIRIKFSGNSSVVIILIKVHCRNSCSLWTLEMHWYAQFNTLTTNV